MYVKEMMQEPVSGVLNKLGSKLGPRMKTSTDVDASVSSGLAKQLDRT